MCNALIMWAHIWGQLSQETAHHPTLVGETWFPRNFFKYFPSFFRFGFACRQISWENVESSKFNLFRECFIPRANIADWQTFKLNKWKSRYSAFHQTFQDFTKYEIWFQRLVVRITHKKLNQWKSHNSKIY